MPIPDQRRMIELFDQHVDRARPIPSMRQTRSNTMTWTTPTAIDFRFGFEITLYIANR
ncbi:MAG: coenzyme PQQ precursor peptide PqqA [Burkholderiaceae bacterium]|jgi:coenzyme PQQ precursor peptide PqqA